MWIAVCLLYLNIQMKKSLKRKPDSSPLIPLAVVSSQVSPREDHTTPAALSCRRSSGRSIKPPRKDFPFEHKKVQLSAALKCCSDVLKEMLSKRHYAYAWPFYVPVDVVALGLHDYHDIITEPMDLSTVRVRPWQSCSRIPPELVFNSSCRRVPSSEENGPRRVRNGCRVCCWRPTDVFQLLQIQPSFAWSCVHGKKTAGIDVL